MSSNRYRTPSPQPQNESFNTLPPPPPQRPMLRRNAVDSNPVDSNTGNSTSTFASQIPVCDDPTTIMYWIKNWSQFTQTSSAYVDKVRVAPVECYNDINRVLDDNRKGINTSLYLHSFNMDVYISRRLF